MLLHCDIVVRISKGPALVDHSEDQSELRFRVKNCWVVHHWHDRNIHRGAGAGGVEVLW